MRRFFLCVIAAILPISALAAQETPRPEITQTAGIFPLALILEAADLAGNGDGTGRDHIWRPDWPLELPPDSFKVLNGKISGAAVEGDGVSLVLRYDPEGRVEEFPFMFCGRMAQIKLVYGEALEIHEMALDFRTLTFNRGRDEPGFQSGEDSWKFEFLEYDDSYPSLVRGFCENTWYFISLSKLGNVIIETWYDEQGLALGAYAFSLVNIGDYARINAFRDYRNPASLIEFFYDSRNLLTECSGLHGMFKVLYFREELPRYWERRPLYGSGDYDDAGNFYLQWDENDFLVRIAGEYENQTDSAASMRPETAECRYEYTLDEKGNWIERREIRMIHRFGLLVPSPGTTFRRILEYSVSE